MLTDKKRLAYVDFLKATAIILVVFGNMLPSGCWPRTLIYAFHVPLFGFVGGLLFTAPAVWGDVGKKSFNVVKRLLIPYAIFFFVCCIFYMLPDASVPTWINASAPQGAKDLIYRFLFLEKKTVWNATLSFMPCYITVSLAFIIYSKLTRGSRIGAILLATLSFGALILMESRGITVNALGVKDVFGFRNYLLMLGFYSVGYSVRPFFDILDGAPRGFERTATALASLCAFVFVAILCLKANAVEATPSQPAGYFGISMYSGLYNGIGQFIAFAVLLYFSLAVFSVALPEFRAARLLSDGSLFVMFMHMFVLLDKTFTDVIPYESMWELDMRIAYRDATAVVVLLLLLLLLFDTVKRKFPKTKAAFEFVGIK